MERWGLGVLGLSRYDFYSMTLPEYKMRIDGFMLREMEIRNLGARRIATILVNGFNSLGGGKPMTEHKLWPFSLDNPKKVPDSAKIINQEKEFIKKFWPDVNL